MNGNAANPDILKIYKASYLETMSSVFIFWAIDAGCTWCPSEELLSVMLLIMCFHCAVIGPERYLSTCLEVMWKRCIQSIVVMPFWKHSCLHDSTSLRGYWAGKWDNAGRVLARCRVHNECEQALPSDSASVDGCLFLGYLFRWLRQNIKSVFISVKSLFPLHVKWWLLGARFVCWNDYLQRPACFEFAMVLWLQLCLFLHPDEAHFTTHESIPFKFCLFPANKYILDSQCCVSRLHKYHHNLSSYPYQKPGSLPCPSTPPTPPAPRDLPEVSFYL